MTMLSTARRHETDCNPDMVEPQWLSHLRYATLECRVSQYCPPSAAFALLGDGKAVEALARALPNMMARRPKIWPPGTDGRSFDESWLEACRAALDRGDAASLRFLMARQLTPGSAAAFRMLLSGLQPDLDAA